MLLLGFVHSLDQFVSQWAASLGWPGEAFLRLLLAGIFGGLVGLEREVRGRQAGFRTNILVCLGSALTMMVSAQLALHPWHISGNEYTIRVDPGRIAYGVMTGIGFLGAGVIMREGTGTIRGLTTAAALWCIAAVGLAVGFGLYLLSLFATLLIVGCLWILDYVEDVIPKVRYRTVTVRVPWAAGAIGATIRRIKEAGLDVVDASFERCSDLSYADVALRIAFTDPEQYYSFERQIAEDSTYQLMATREI
jgi:putative Mg2+ transporter-C (MgtC) family protein